MARSTQTGTNKKKKTAIIPLVSGDGVHHMTSYSNNSNYPFYSVLQHQ